jgi:hypothetical protein
MLIYTNQKSKQTRKQKLKQKQRWEKAQIAVNGTISKSKEKFSPLQQKTPAPLRPGASEYKKYTSLDTAQCNTFKKESPKYTGEAMIGIGTMHKSNAVPIFSTDEAKDISSMRR